MTPGKISVHPLAALPSPIREMLATHEALRKLGFKPDEIFAVAGTTGYVGIRLQAQGLELNVVCGELPAGEATAKDFLGLWERTAEMVRSGAFASADLHCVYARSWVFAHRQELVGVMVAKGFHFPLSQN